MPSQGGCLAVRAEGNRPRLDRLRNRGWVVVSIGYRLAPLDPWPAQPTDVRISIDWWRSTGADLFGAPADPLVGMGWSAGGQLAEWVTVEDGGPAFDAAVSVSGSTYWPDRTTDTATQALFGLPGVQSVTAMTDASSVTHLDAGDPPLLHFTERTTRSSRCRRPSSSPTRSTATGTPRGTG
ncbi:MAG: alpha/beta hydrolase [Microthrixaceae bacterium]